MKRHEKERTFKFIYILEKITADRATDLIFYNYRTDNMLIAVQNILIL